MLKFLNKYFRFNLIICCPLRKFNYRTSAISKKFSVQIKCSKKAGRYTAGLG